MRNLTATVLLGGSLTLVACGASTATRPITSAKSNGDAKAKKPSKAVEKAAATTAPARATAQGRRIGDYVVYRISGSFRSDPITMSERVVAQTDGELVIEVELRSNELAEKLHVHEAASGSRAGEILAVFRLTGAEETPMSVDRYEALLAKTTLSADENLEALPTEKVERELGGAKVVCESLAYRVKVDGKSATLRTSSSDRFAWGDVSGELVGDDGNVLYRVEVVETGHGLPPLTQPTVAQTDEEYE